MDFFGVQKGQNMPFNPDNLPVNMVFTKFKTLFTSSDLDFINFSLGALRDSTLQFGLALGRQELMQWCKLILLRRNETSSSLFGIILSLPIQGCENLMVGVM